MTVTSTSRTNRPLSSDGVLTVDAITTTISSGVTNRHLEYGLLQAIFTNVTTSTRTNRPADATVDAALSGPFVRNRSPSPGANNVLDTAPISFNIVQLLPSTLNLASFLFQIQINLGAPITVYDAMSGGFQPGYSGSLTPSATAFEDISSVIINSSIPWPRSALITVHVFAANNLTVNIAPPESWSFVIEPESAPPPPPVVPPVSGAKPDSDTIRGGRDVVIFGPGPFDGVTETLFSKTLPTGWTPILINEAVVNSTLHGLDIIVGPDASSEVLIDIPTVLTGFDAAVDIEIRLPQSALSDPFDALSLEFIGGTTDVVTRAAVVMNPAISRDRLIGIASSTGGTLTGGAVVSPSPSMLTTLRLIRSGSHVWAFLGTRGTGSSLLLDTWATLIPIGTLIIPSESGTLRLAVRNLTNASKVSIHLSNFTLRSHAMINGRLLDNKVVTSRQRILGKVPAATLADVGVTTIQIFGPGIVGVATAPFEYTLPSPFTSGQRVFDRLRIYTDPALFDKE